MEKSYVILCMYEELLKGNPLCIDNCLVEYRISVPTFRRYLALLREFFAERHGADIRYDKTEKGYYLERRT
ncbi:MAG: hypothetical protein IJY62_01270 [Clostridia bacterium]|nr:hypothetical protein [Clostridia bacterium]